MIARSRIEVATEAASLDQAAEHIDCPFCHSLERRPWGSENGYHCEKCLTCGLVYVTPRPVLAEISNANRIGEHKSGDGTLNVTYARSGRKVNRYKRQISELFKDRIESAEPCSWLDIGAGYGELVEALMSLLPAASSVLGIEPMEPKVRCAQAQGLPVVQKELSEVKERYDVISLINVFSHVPDFRSFLSEVVTLLKPGGELLIESGNGGDLDSATDYPDLLCLPDHLVFGGEKHFVGFLSEAGFSNISVWSERRDTLLWTLKGIVKKALGRKAKITLPYQSPFRIIFVRGRLSLPQDLAQAPVAQG